MIVFNLETLASDKQRRHFIDPWLNPDIEHGIPPNQKGKTVFIFRDYNIKTGELWDPDFEGYWNACDKDEPIRPVIFMAFPEIYTGNAVVWSDRSEKYREATVKWLADNVCHTNASYQEFDWNPVLRMRSKEESEDYSPSLFRKWTEELLISGTNIDCAFESNPEILRMYIKKGIFTFNCNQRPE